MRSATVYIALGSNLGDRRANLAAACEKLAERAGAGRGVRLSPIYETAPVGGPPDQGPFLNAVAELETALAPAELLGVCQAIERELGRPPRDERSRWGPRVLDLDLLFYDDQVLDAPGLRVPHPRLHQRWFVLQPMADLAPELGHPVLGRTIRELLAELDQPQMNADEHG